MDDSTIQYILSDKEVDPVSNVPFSTVVFMLYYGLELKHFLTDISDELIDRYDLEKQKIGQYTLYRSGSVAQGFYLNTNYLPDARDVDVVAISHRYDIRETCKYDTGDDEGIVVSDTGELGSEIEADHDKQREEVCPTTSECVDDNEQYFNLKVLPDTPPGYVLIERCRRHRKPDETTSERFVSSLKATEVRVKFWSDLRKIIRQRFDDDRSNARGKESNLFSSFEPHGPAATAFMSLYETTTPFETDLVFCVSYPLPWPKSAAEFLTRNRPSGWPSKSLIDDIFKDGCTLIPKGEVGSRLEDYEWRISFTGELRLARALNRTQRELVHALKALISEPQHPLELLEISTSVESYHLLNLIYRESETADPSVWSPRNMAKMMFLLLDKYSEHFRLGYLPHYFISSRNVFAKYKDLTEEEVDTVQYTVLRIRYNPIRQIIQQEKYLNLPPYLHQWVFEPITEGLRLGFGSSIHPICYVQALLRLSKAHLKEEHFDKSLLYASDAKRFFDLIYERDKTLYDFVDVYLTLAIAMHRNGDLDNAQVTLEALERKIDKETDNVDQYINALFYQIRGRILFAEFCKSVNKDQTKLDRVWYAYNRSMAYTFYALHSVAEMMYFVMIASGPKEFKWKATVVDTFVKGVFGDVVKADLEELEILYDRKQQVRMRAETSCSSDATDIFIPDERQSSPSENGNTRKKQGNIKAAFEESMQTPIGMDIEEERDFQSEHSMARETGMKPYVVAELDISPSYENPSKCETETTTIVGQKQTLFPYPISDCELSIEEESPVHVNHESADQKFNNDFISDQNQAILQENDADITDADIDDKQSGKDEKTVEIIYDRKAFKQARSSGKSSKSAAQSEFVTPTNADNEEEHLKYTAADINMVDSRLIKDLCRAKLFQELGLQVKSVEIMERLKVKVRSIRQSGVKVNMEMVEKAYKLFLDAANAMKELSNHDGEDVIDKNYVYFSSAEKTFLDDILGGLFEKLGVSALKIPVHLLLLHTKIIYYRSMQMPQISKKILREMEEFTDDFAEGSDIIDICDCMVELHQLGLNTHFPNDNRGARGIGASQRYDSTAYAKQTPVKEQVFTWIEAVFEAMKQYEPKNKYLDEVFTY